MNQVDKPFFFDQESPHKINKSVPPKKKKTFPENLTKALMLPYNFNLNKTENFQSEMFKKTLFKKLQSASRFGLIDPHHH